jgi:hypothetical protein
VTSPTRTRTSPEVKWVANELAAVMGEIERIDETLARLSARKAHLLEVRAALSSVAGQLAVPELPEVMPSVRAHERYGTRGSMRDFLRDVLKRACPKGVTTAALTDAVIEAFDVQIAGPKERNRFRNNSVRSALKAVRDAGEVEPVHGRVKTGGSVKSVKAVGTVGQSGVWRLKAKAPSMDELRRLARQLAEERG